MIQHTEVMFSVPSIAQWLGYASPADSKLGLLLPPIGGHWGRLGQPLSGGTFPVEIRESNHPCSLTPKEDYSLTPADRQPCQIAPP